MTIYYVICRPGGLCREKVCPWSKTKKSIHFFTCTVRHLNSLFVPPVGHLQVCFKKILMPRGWPREGGGWALLEMTDALQWEDGDVNLPFHCIFLSVPIPFLACSYHCLLSYSFDKIFGKNVMLAHI